MSETQNKMLKAWLDEGETITQHDAMYRFGIGRLASRINDLKEAGYPIDSQFIRVRKANGESARVKEYWRGKA